MPRLEGSFPIYCLELGSKGRGPGWGLLLASYCFKSAYRLSGANLEGPVGGLPGWNGVKGSTRGSQGSVAMK